jgi:TolB protein
MDTRIVTKSRPGRVATLRAAAPLAWLLLLVALAATLKLTGCARNSPAEADIREVRVTNDGVGKHSVRFSPDGQWIAYGAKVSPEKGIFGVFIIPRAGGEPKRISPDTLGAYPIEWTSDGTGVFCRSLDGQIVYHIALDGSARVASRGEPLTRLTAISADGTTELLLRFNRDNRDVGIRHAGGKFEFLANTPEWEEDASFGPGPGEVTAVSLPSYQASSSKISIWSPNTRAFSALPLPDGQNFQPAWSPDGRLMAFSSQRDGQWDVWVYEAGTTRTARLTDDPEDVSCPRWSPDGEWLAFCRSTRSSHIYAGDPRKPGQRQLTSGPARDNTATVSPDGKWIAFVRRAASGNGGQHGPQLCVMPVTGGDVKVLDLKSVALPSKIGEGGIAWSADSRELAINANEGAAKMDIYRIGRDGRGLARVTVEPSDECDPRWSPDGRHIVFTRAGGGETGVAVVPSNGGLPIDVSPKGELGESGVWSPGSDRLAYVTIPDDGSFQIWVAPLATPEKRMRVLTSKDVAWPLFWSRDGNEIILARGKSPDWYFSACSVPRGTETKIAWEASLPSGNGMYPELAPAGEKYRDLFYPGGIVLADGKENSDIYMIRARDIVKSRLLTSRGE